MERTNEGESGIRCEELAVDASSGWPAHAGAIPGPSEDVEQGMRKSWFEYRRDHFGRTLVGIQGAIAASKGRQALKGMGRFNGHGSSMRADPTGRLVGLVVLVALGSLAAIAMGSPVMEAVVAPFAIWLVWGLSSERTRPCTVQLSLDRDRAVEGEVVNATLAVSGDPGWERIVVSVRVPAGLVVESPPARFAIAPDAGGLGSATIVLRCSRWGVHEVGPVTIEAHGAPGLFIGRAVAATSSILRVYPAGIPVRSRLDTARTQAYVGNQRSRLRGDGFEFADVRPYLPGDQPRRINWRVTARQSRPYVTHQHPEQNADVILFVDTFADVHVDQEGTLAWEGRAVAALAQIHIASRDRVGVISFGGVLRWLSPGTGPNHLYRILDTLLDTTVVPSYTWPRLDILPGRTLPPQSIVVALTPLTEPRTVRAILDLRGRGHEVVVIEVDPEPFTSLGASVADQLSQRIWRLHRSARRHRILSAGVPLVRWDTAEPLDAAITQLNWMRRIPWRVRS